MEIQKYIEPFVKDCNALYKQHDENRNLQRLRVFTLAERVAGVALEILAVSLALAAITSSPLIGASTLTLSAAFFMTGHDLFIHGHNISSDINGRISGYLSELVTSDETIFSLFAKQIMDRTLT
jgi:hypothetical protein